MRNINPNGYASDPTENRYFVSIAGDTSQPGSYSDVDGQAICDEETAEISFSDFRDPPAFIAANYGSDYAGKTAIFFAEIRYKGETDPIETMAGNSVVIA